MIKRVIERETFLGMFPVSREIKDENLLIRVIAVWNDMLSQSKWQRLEDACFSPEIGHEKLIGHINAVVEGTVRMSECVQKYQHIDFDKDLIISFGLLHDVSKLVEYEPGANGTCVKSEIGHKIQHGVMGAICAQKHGFSIDYMHLILTHTPLSKMKPKVKEAVLFSYIDLCDADLLHLKNGLPLYLKD